MQNSPATKRLQFTMPGIQLKITKLERKKEKKTHNKEKNLSLIRTEIDVKMNRQEH